MHFFFVEKFKQRRSCSPSYITYNIKHFEKNIQRSDSVLSLRFSITFCDTSRKANTSNDNKFSVIEKYISYPKHTHSLKFNFKNF